MKIKSSVEERRAGTSGAIFAGSLDCGFLDTGIVDKTGIAIGTEHKHTAAVDGYFGILLGRDGTEIRIDSGCLGFLRSGIFGEFGL